MHTRTYGYVRVSTRDQNEDRQLIALAPLQVDRIYLDKQSGKDFARPAYRRMLRAIRPGDLVIVKSIDRLGRNYEEIIAQWKRITRDKGADICVLDMPLLDTRARDGSDLTRNFISDLVLQILSYVAQTERENIRQRQAEGIAAAQRRGVKFGRPPKPVPEGFGELRALWQQGQVSSRQAAQMLQIHHSTFLRWVSEKNFGA